MKISDFANKFGMSKHTIRYYMDLKLIIAEKKGGHYDFDEKCEEQLKEILSLKEMGFSLEEVKRVFNFNRIGKLSPYQDNRYYLSIFQNKLIELDDQIKRLNQAKENLHQKLSSLEREGNHKSTKSGVDLAVLSLFECPDCGNDLLLEAERVEFNQVINGRLKCDCGSSLEIKDGILYSNHIQNREVMIEDDFLEEYIEFTDQQFIDYLYQGLDWMERQIHNEDISKKVILEPGSGFGLLLRQIYTELPKDSIYICIERNPDINIFLKEMLEQIKKDTKIVFITAELPELPLKEGVIDILIDYTGISNYALERSDFLPASIDTYLKNQSLIIASFIVYNKFGRDNIISTKYRHNFKSDHIKAEVKSLDYQLKRDQLLCFEPKGNSIGKFERLYQSGDQMNLYQFKAKR